MNKQRSGQFTLQRVKPLILTLNLKDDYMYFDGIKNENIEKKQRPINSRVKTRRLTKAEKDKYSKMNGSGIKPTKQYNLGYRPKI